jgi:hypothetical protein
MLLTVCNGPGVRTGAAIQFKTHIGSLLTDRLEESDASLGGKSIWDAWPPELADLKDDKHGARLLAFMRLGTQWPVRLKKYRPLLEEWLARLYAEPVHCWIVGGHHHGHFEFDITAKKERRYHAMLWGSQAPSENNLDFYRPYGGFGVHERNDSGGQKRQVLEWFGYRDPSRPGEPAVVEIPGAQTALQNVRLMMVFGCNGVPVMPVPKLNNEWVRSMSRTWQKWQTSGNRRPMIVGWFNTKRMPPDKQGGTPGYATDLFADKLKVLASNLSGDKFLTLFDNQNADGRQQIMQSWGASCWQAFHNKPWPPPKDELPPPPYRTLWTECGVLSPDLTVWHANTKFKGQQLTPPFDLSDPTKLPLIKVGTTP